MKKIGGSTEQINEQIRAWSKEGTIESVEKIRQIMVDTEDDQVFVFAKLSYDEALYNTFAPKTDNEEQEFLFGRMIHRAEEKMFDLTLERDKLERLLAEDEINRLVHQKVLKRATKKEKNAWQYHWTPDHSWLDRNRLTDVVDTMGYTKVWIEQAKKVFASPKYKKAPREIYASIQSRDSAQGKAL